MDDSTDTHTQTQSRDVFTVADISKRLIAAIVDALMVGSVYGVAYMAFYAIFGMEARSVQLLQLQQSIIQKISDGGNISDIVISNFGPIILFGVITSGILFLAYITFYIIIPSTIFYGQTFGKKILGLRVIRQNGDKTSFMTFVKRHILGLILLFCFVTQILSCLTYCLGFIYVISNLIKIFSNPLHQSIGDSVAETVVVAS